MTFFPHKRNMILKVLFSFVNLLHIGLLKKIHRKETTKIYQRTLSGSEQLKQLFFSDDFFFVS